jgi:hypothetical protein
MSSPIGISGEYPLNPGVKEGMETELLSTTLGYEDSGTPPCDWSVYLVDVETLLGASGIEDR